MGYSVLAINIVLVCTGKESIANFPPHVHLQHNMHKLMVTQRTNEWHSVGNYLTLYAQIHGHSDNYSKASAGTEVFTTLNSQMVQVSKTGSQS
jgi:hypothetical protein